MLHMCFSPFYLYHGLLPFTGLCYSSSYLPIEAN